MINSRNQIIKKIDYTILIFFGLSSPTKNLSWLTFDFIFLRNLGATYSSRRLLSIVVGLMTGWLAGCCIDRKAYKQKKRVIVRLAVRIIDLAL